MRGHFGILFNQLLFYSRKVMTTRMITASTFNQQKGSRMPGWRKTNLINKKAV